MAPRISASTTIGPSLPHHTSEPQNAWRVVLEPGGIGEDRLHVADPLHPRMVGIPSLGLGDPADEVPDVDLLPEDLERAADHTGGVDEHAQDRVHAVRVVHDALQHHRPLLLGHRVPPTLEGVAEALHGGEGRPDVVRRPR